MIVSERQRKKIIPFAGGKGGTGKTFIAVNVAIRLGQQGRKVLLVDLDLGGSNAHTYLHVKNQHYGIANYIYNEELSFGELVQETPYQNLHFVAGDALSPGVAAISRDQLREALGEIFALPYDYIILDLASGARSISLAAFSMVNSGILVGTPDLASVLNMYNFFKSAVFTIMLDYAVQEDRQEVAHYLRAIMGEQEPNSTPKLNEILLEVERLDAHASHALRERIYSMKPFLVLNRIRGEQDLEAAHNVQHLIHKNMNIELEFLGAIFEDAASVNQASEAQTPLIEADLESCARTDLDRIAQKILLSPDFPILPLDLEMYDSTFGLVELEVQQVVREGGGGEIGALEREEYRALIESQQQKIAELEEAGGMASSQAREPLPSLEASRRTLSGAAEAISGSASASASAPASAPSDGGGGGGVGVRATGGGGVRATGGAGGAGGGAGGGARANGGAGGGAGGGAATQRAHGDVPPASGAPSTAPAAPAPNAQPDNDGSAGRGGSADRGGAAGRSEDSV